MRWPDELIALLTRGLEVQPAEGLTADHVHRAFLDETARRAVWRARGNPARLGAALRTPYTPIGSITASCVNGLARQLRLSGPEWADAVHGIYDFMEEHAEAVCAAFKDDGQPYPSDIGMEGELE
jgi:hypothetical protein